MAYSNLTVQIQRKDGNSKYNIKLYKKDSCLNKDIKNKNKKEVETIITILSKERPRRLNVINYLLKYLFVGYLNENSIPKDIRNLANNSIITTTTTNTIQKQEQVDDEEDEQEEEEEEEEEDDDEDVEEMVSKVEKELNTIEITIPISLNTDDDEEEQQQQQHQPSYNQNHQQAQQMLLYNEIAIKQTVLNIYDFYKDQHYYLFPKFNNDYQQPFIIPSSNSNMFNSDIEQPFMSSISNYHYDYHHHTYIPISSSSSLSSSSSSSLPLIDPLYNFRIN